MITYMMGGYWYFACQMLSSAAHILAEDFQMVSEWIQSVKPDDDV